MYRSFYGLDRKPFQISTNPSFLWLGELHKEAFTLLKYGILESQGFLLLTGDVGTGKTTLINALTDSLGDEFIVAKVPDPGMETIDFMNYISHAFDMKKKFVSKDAFLIHFGHFLNSAHAARKKVLLIIDESQRLSSDMLEEVRQLSNIEKQGTKLLSIFFIGQNEFNDVLQENKNRALQQRISLNYLINPLAVHETGEFIRHRLKVAGTEEQIFSSEAISNIYQFSGGFPRRINIICDHALLSGFYQGTKNVTGDMVRKCAKDLCLPGSSEKTGVASLESDDCPGSEQLKVRPPERLHDVSSTHAVSTSVWRTFATVLLVAMMVFIVTYSKSSREYRDFFSPVQNNGMSVSSALPEINVKNINSSSESHIQTSSLQVLSTAAEILVSDEAAGPVEPSIAKELVHEDAGLASVALKDDNAVVLLETTPASIQPVDPSDIYLMEKDVAGEGNSASLLMVCSFPPYQQSVIGENAIQTRPFFLENIVLESAMGLVDEEIEATERIVMNEESLSLVDVPVAQTQTISVIDVVDTRASDENENESEEFVDTKNDSIAHRGLGAYLGQDKDNYLSTKPSSQAGLIDVEDVGDVGGDEAEFIDPTAVIDWVIKNHSK